MKKIILGIACLSLLLTNCEEGSELPKPNIEDEASRPLPELGDVDPPNITSVSSTGTTITVNWTTNVAMRVELKISRVSNFNYSSVQGGGLSTGNSFTFTDLVPGVKYYIKMQGTKINGSQVSPIASTSKTTSGNLNPPDICDAEFDYNNLIYGWWGFCEILDDKRNSINSTSELLKIESKMQIFTYQGSNSGAGEWVDLLEQYASNGCTHYFDNFHGTSLRRIKIKWTYGSESTSWSSWYQYDHSPAYQTEHESGNCN
ncbi:MAG: fibronectin type III domain-containing protein [Reichenbachiella sp.]|uniref:fibronectin type III domain-containing protein n=1 Tax=Reichenbachiella sp. TaxID=2184521 RepID=UPI00329A57FD